jgi:hypothetical protein
MNTLLSHEIEMWALTRCPGTLRRYFLGLYISDKINGSAANRGALALAVRTGFAAAAAEIDPDLPAVTALSKIIRNLQVRQTDGQYRVERWAHEIAEATCFPSEGRGFRELMAVWMWMSRFPQKHMESEWAEFCRRLDESIEVRMGGRREARKALELELLIELREKRDRELLAAVKAGRKP